MWIQKTRWSNSKKQVFQGERYDSGFEMGYAQELNLRQKAKEIIKWERQVKIPLVVNNYTIANYYIDFIVYYPDGTKEFVECKGWPSDVWRMKWKIFEALFSELPNVKLTVIKQANNFTLRKIKKV